MRSIRSMIVLMLICLFGFVLIFSQSRAEDKEKLSGKNLKITRSTEAGTAFELLITDDPADELTSKGEVKFISFNVEFEQPFYLEKGKSAK